MKSLRLLLAFIVILMLAIKPSNGQIQITSGSAVTPEQMVENIVGEGIQFSNVSYIGADTARGIFTNGSSTNLGFESGIFLTSGAGYVIPGPNSSASAGANNGVTYPCNPPWGPDCFDPAILDFDFIPDSDTLWIKYVFGSEEYNEWVGASLTDIFFLNISGPNPSGGQYANKNIAIVPGTPNIGVKINTVNNGYSPPGVIPTGPCNHCEYYDDNTGGLTLQYDGFTIVLTGWLLVIPCETYHTQFAVMDAGDGIYDTGVFIEEDSFNSSVKIDVRTVLDPPGLTEEMVEGHVEADLIFKLPGAEYAPVTICFEIDGTAINGIDYEWIDNCITFEEGQDSAIIHLTPLQDGVIEGDETIVLIIENTLGCSVKYDTVEHIILDYLDMISVISPNTMICSGQEVQLMVEVFNGFPPYTYNWQPGGFTNDTIVVSPESTTYYKVLCVDFLNDTIADSVLVTVFNGNLNNILEFGFAMENNPFLPFDITGSILQDSVLLFLPDGVPLIDLVSSFSLSNCARTFVNGEEQFSGVSVLDFTGPVVYEVMAANGEIHNWLVLVEIQTGMNEASAGGVTILPNPSDGKFYIDISNQDSEPITMQILDLTGRIVFEIEPAIGKKFEIDLFAQRKGMYFVRVKSNNGLLTQKIVIQ
jgi:hypothetical protein